ncbi:MAG: hypothetical protein Q8J64_04575 [Thermodesulfovibrionales bacterium]|nr:hypothetical protein [Thermodesulfovibrionales bacterium]
MLKVKKNIVIDEKGRESSVLLPIKDYKKLVEYIEDLEDVAAYDKGKRAGGEIVPFERAVREIEKKYGKLL